MTVQRASDLRLAHALMERRLARVPAATSLHQMERHPRRSMRRWLGRRLVALGSRLANEPAMRPARAR
jgi:hypothetical protein